MSVALVTISSHGNLELFTRETRVKVMTETRQPALYLLHSFNILHFSVTEKI